MLVEFAAYDTAIIPGGSNRHGNTDWLCHRHSYRHSFWQRAQHPHAEHACAGRP